MFRISALLLAVVVITSNTPVLGDNVPRLVNYQGRITDGDGEPLNTTTSMTFRLFPSQTEGLSFWSEVHSSVTVVDGLFSVLLSIDAEVIETADAWLAIEVEGEVISPRSRIAAGIFSYEVGTVDGASGGQITSDLEILGDAAVTGKATIGTGHTNTGAASFVSGQDNIAEGAYSVVLGGRNNYARGDYSIICGGGGPTLLDSNLALDGAVVVGGVSNVSETYSFVGSGSVNNARDGSFIGSGSVCSADHASVVGAGETNSAEEYSVIGSGMSNSITCEVGYSVIGTGQENSITSDYSVIGCGQNNTISGDYSVIGGGASNEVLDTVCTIGGGFQNVAEGG